MNEVTDIKGLLSPKLFTTQEQLTKKFQAAPFFPHLNIDKFFAASFCHKLASDFPAFEQGFEQNEQGYLNKAYARRVRHDDKIDLCCRQDITSMGCNFTALDSLFKSTLFLETMSTITGIPDLLYDPEYIGGGTHENLDGAQLDPHVDFNYHPHKKWHRRLNIIFFLNEEWDKDWGGHFEVHKDPWSKAKNEIINFVPRFNTCVMFATSEHSWHGFSKITFPKNNHKLSRKTIALYLYSRTRPESETASSHSTVYIPRNIPEKIRPGVTLTEKDVADLHEIVARRNDIIKFLYKREQEFSAIIASLKKPLLANVPLIGLIRQVGPSSGLYDDKWVSRQLKFSVSAIADINNITIKGWLPDVFENLMLVVQLNGVSKEKKVSPGLFSLKLDLPFKANSTCDIAVFCSSTFVPAKRQPSKDSRELSFKLEEILFV